MVVVFFFFKQKTAYEMRISDWSSDVCSSDLVGALLCLSFRRQPLRPLPPHPRRAAGDDPPGRAHHRRRARRGERRRRRGPARKRRAEIGRASCRDRGCPYVLISGVAVSLKTKKQKKLPQ